MKTRSLPLDDEGYVTCIFCFTKVPQYDIIGAGDGPSGAFDHPAEVECDGCGAHYCDSNLVAPPPEKRA